MSHKTRFILIVAVVLLLAGAGVYVRRKARADGSAPVQLGAREGATHEVSASQPGVAAVQAAAAEVRAAFTRA
jgi:hypothetical protein